MEIPKTEVENLTEFLRTTEIQGNQLVKILLEEKGLEYEHGSKLIEDNAQHYLHELTKYCSGNLLNVWIDYYEPHNKKIKPYTTIYFKHGNKVLVNRTEKKYISNVLTKKINNIPKKDIKKSSTKKTRNMSVETIMDNFLNI